jgi:hypothetical protein
LIVSLSDIIAPIEHGWMNASGISGHGNCLLSRVSTI